MKLILATTHRAAGSFSTVRLHGAKQDQQLDRYPITCKRNAVSSSLDVVAANPPAKQRRQAAAVNRMKRLVAALQSSGSVRFRI